MRKLTRCGGPQIRNIIASQMLYEVTMGSQLVSSARPACECTYVDAYTGPGVGFPERVAWFGLT